MKKFSERYEELHVNTIDIIDKPEVKQFEKELREASKEFSDVADLVVNNKVLRDKRGSMLSTVDNITKQLKKLADVSKELTIKIDEKKKK